jgi:hypothetical protein
MVLDAVTSPELILFLNMPGDGQRALELLFDRCAADGQCRQYFPNFREEYESILADLDDQPKDIQVADPLNGEDLNVKLNSEFLSNLIFGALYHTDLTTLLPLLVHQAFETGDYGPLVSQGLMAGGSGEINLSLLYVVACAEDAPFIELSEAAAIQEKTLFADRAGLFLKICEIFPETEVAPELRRPLDFDKPVLLLSGEADPVTPPYYAEEVAANLPNSQHFIAANMGHGLLARGCVAEIVTQFIEKGSTAGLDPACIKNIKPGPFFTDSAGPGP